MKELTLEEVNNLTYIKLSKKEKKVKLTFKNSDHKTIPIIGQGAFSLIIPVKNNFVAKISSEIIAGEMPSDILREYIITKKLYNLYKNNLFCPFLEPTLIKNNVYYGIIMKKCTCCLHDYMRSTPLNKRLQQLPSIFKQLIISLFMARKQGIIHRDIKPANILVDKLANQKLAVYLSDWGLARYVCKDIGRFRRAYTIWFRAPELLALEKGKREKNIEFLEKTEREQNYGTFWNPPEPSLKPKPTKDEFGIYGFESEVWALGCTILSFIMGKYMFKVDDLDTIVNDIKQKIEPLSTRIDVIGWMGTVLDIYDILHVPTLLINLLKQMLDTNLETRITLEQMLEHEYVKTLNIHPSEYLEQENKNNVTGTKVTPLLVPIPIPNIVLPINPFINPNDKKQKPKKIEPDKFDSQSYNDADNSTSINIPTIVCEKVTDICDDMGFEKMTIATALNVLNEISLIRTYDDIDIATSIWLAKKIDDYDIVYETCIEQLILCSNEELGCNILKEDILGRIITIIEGCIVNNIIGHNMRKYLNKD